TAISVAGAAGGASVATAAAGTGTAGRPRATVNHSTVLPSAATRSTAGTRGWMRITRRAMGATILRVCRGTGEPGPENARTTRAARATGTIGVAAMFAGAEPGRG